MNIVWSKGHTGSLPAKKGPSIYVCCQKATYFFSILYMLPRRIKIWVLNSFIKLLCTISNIRAHLYTGAQNL